MQGYKVAVADKKNGVYLSLENEVEKENEEDNDENDESKSKSSKSKSGKKAKASKTRELDEQAVFGAFLHKSSLSAQEQLIGANAKNESIDSLWNRMFRVGTEMEVRVMGYQLLEGTILVSNTESFVHGEVVHASQVKPGQQLTVEVLKAADYGLVVQLGGRVRGICPMVHLSDTGAIIPKINKKFKQGQKLVMRVWEVDKSAIVMTMKKSIVEDESEVIGSYDDAKEGNTALGIVSKISEKGLQLHLYNKVKGEIPMSVLVKQGVLDVDESYRIGQVVKCVILRKTHVIHDPKSKSKSHTKLILGLSIGDTSNILASTESELRKFSESDNALTASNGSNDGNGQEKECEFVSGTVVKCDTENIFVRLDNGNMATLHQLQLCDIAAYSIEIFSSGKYSSGTRIENAVVLTDKSNSKHSGGITISIKPLIVEVAQKSKTKVSILHFPYKVTDLIPGQELVGYVHKVESYGVLVRFRDTMTALAPRPNVADKFISSPVGLFNIGDSIRCVVQRVDLTKDRAIITLKPALITPSTGNSNYLSCLLRDSFLSSKESSSTNLPNWKTYPVGSVVKATVSSIKDYGIVLMAEDRVTMMLASDYNTSATIKVGTALDVVVLDLDLESKVLNVTLNTEVITRLQQVSSSTASKKKSKNADIKSLPVGDVVDGTVLMIKKQYLVVLVQSIVGYVMVSDYHCPYLTTENFVAQQKITVRVEKCPQVTSAATFSYPHEGSVIFSLFEQQNEQIRNQVARLQQEAKDVDMKLKETSDNQISDDKIDHNSETLRIGNVVKCTVSNVTALVLHVSLESSQKDDHMEVEAMIHLSGAIDASDGCDNLESSLERGSALSCKERQGISCIHPFAQYQIGSVVHGRVLQVRRNPGSKSVIVYLGLVPTNSKNPQKIDEASKKWCKMCQWTGNDGIKQNKIYAGVVTSFDELGCILSISPYISARLNLLDVSNDKSIVEKFRDGSFIGMKVVVAVCSVTLNDKTQKDHFKSHVALSRSLIEDQASGATMVDLSRGSVVSFEKKVNLVKGKTLSGIVDLSIGAKVPQAPAFQILFGM